MSTCFPCRRRPTLARQKENLAAKVDVQAESLSTLARISWLANQRRSMDEVRQKVITSGVDASEDTIKAVDAPLRLTPSPTEAGSSALSLNFGQLLPEGCVGQ